MCGWRLAQCRLCRMEQLKKGLRAIVPPAGSATYGTHRCATCGRQGLHLQHCNGCRALRYCNRECQKRDWTEHKQVCGFLAALVIPKQEHLHVVYSWQVLRLPSSIGRVPHGIRGMAWEAYNTVCDRSDAQINLMPRPPRTPVLRGARRRTARRIMCGAQIEWGHDHIHMGISLTDGIGWIDLDC